MRAGGGLGEGHLGVAHQGRVVVHRPVGGQHPAVPVVGELVQAQITHDHGGVAHLGPQVAEREVENAVRVGPAEPIGSLRAGTPKTINPPSPASATCTATLRRESRVCCTTPGIEPIGAGSLRPSRDEHGQHEVGRVQPGLGHQAPQGRRAAAAGVGDRGTGNGRRRPTRPSPPQVALRLADRRSEGRSTCSPAASAATRWRSHIRQGRHQGRHRGLGGQDVHPESCSWAVLAVSGPIQAMTVVV